MHLFYLSSDSELLNMDNSERLFIIDQRDVIEECVIQCSWNISTLMLYLEEDLECLVDL